MTLPTLSRTLHPDNYHHLTDEVARVGHARNLFGHFCQYDHEHRAWEYSICLASLGPREAIPGLNILDVGGGYSLLGGILRWSGANVTVVDVSDHRWQVEEMGRRAVACPSHIPGGSTRFRHAEFTGGIGEQFDAVFSVSVVEHVPTDDAFFASLRKAVRPGGVLVLTTDFHPSGQPQLTGHIRTYNGEALERWGTLDPEFYSPGGFDYHDRGNHVFGYNFASLCLRRNL